MAATLVQTATAPSAHLFDVHRTPREDKAAEFTLAQATPDELLVAQLSWLASQHHTSEYNRVKFGRGGASATYIPLCLHMPEQFKQLRSHQARHAQMQAWWPCFKQTPPQIRLPHSRDPPLCRPRGNTDLQEDLLTAIASPFVPQVKTAPRPVHTFIKTSDTHPINMSSMVPAELLPILSAHIAQADHLSPVTFNVPLAFQLHRVISQPPNTSLAVQRAANRNLDTFELKGIVPPTTVSRQANLSGLFWNQKLMCSSFSNANAGKVQFNALLSSFPQNRARNAPKECSNQAFVFPPSCPCVPSIARRKAAGELQIEKRVTSDDCCDDLSHSRGIASYSCPSTTPQIPNSHKISSATLEAGHSMQSHKFILGNLWLSSCPGKKVRVDGPVDGRSGVCRDIYQDMKRIRDSGAGCLVCCLDDDELRLLGAPWGEYSRTAHGLGMDVLRIPMPEGLAPADVEAFDSRLQCIIDSYTLRGIPVLVHCRGGIGRAGLVACCWTIKLGLCGQVDAQPSVQADTSPACAALKDVDGLPPAAIVRRDTLQLIERVITLVRKRRSLKAVETFEQVKFLVEYVEFLRNRAVRDDVQGSITSPVSS